MPPGSLGADVEPVGRALGSASKAQTVGPDSGTGRAGRPAGRLHVAGAAAVLHACWHRGSAGAVAQGQIRLNRAHKSSSRGAVWVRVRPAAMQEASLLEEVAVQYSGTYDFVSSPGAASQLFNGLFDILVRGTERQHGVTATHIGARPVGGAARNPRPGLSLLIGVAGGAQRGVHGASASGRHGTALRAWGSTPCGRGWSGHRQCCYEGLHRPDACAAPRTSY